MLSQSFDYNVFLSHSAQDKPAARALAQRLQADRLRVWLDERPSQPSDALAPQTQQDLERSRRLTFPLPWKGPFQKLEVIAGRLETDFGPGDPGYVGGHWWLDLNGNGIMDAPGAGGDKYFSCPLLGPGRAAP